LVRRGPAIMKASRLSYRSPDIPFLAVVSFVKMSSSISPLLPRTGERQSKGEQDTWHLSCFQLVCGPKKKVSPFQKSSFWVPVTEGDKLRNQKTVHRREFFYFAYWLSCCEVVISFWIQYSYWKKKGEILWPKALDSVQIKPVTGQVQIKPVTH
jgi:hypothetical protein